MNANEQRLLQQAFPPPRPKVDPSEEPNWGIDQRPRDSRCRVDVWQVRKLVLAFRRERGWTQSELARITGTCQPTISRIENAHHTVSPHIWARLAKLEWRHRQPKIDLTVKFWEQN